MSSAHNCCICKSHQTDHERIQRILHDQYTFNVQCISANQNLTELITERETKIALHEAQINEQREEILKLKSELGSISH